MADLSKINEIRAKVLSAAFGEGLSADKKLSLIFQQISVSAKGSLQTASDKFGAQQARGPVLDRSVTGLNLSSYTSHEGKIIGSLTKHLGAEAYRYRTQDDTLAKLLGVETEGRAKVNLSWDRFTARAFAQQKLTQNEIAPFVNVKRIAKTAFPDLPEYGPIGQNITDLSKSISLRLSKSTPETGSSLYYFKESFESFGAPIEKLSPSQQLEAIFNAAIMKAANEGNINTIKQQLHQSGVRGLSGIQVPIGSEIDPYGLRSIFQHAVKQDSKGGFYTGSAAENSDDFFKKLKHFYGEKYTSEVFKPFTEKVYKAAPGLEGKIGFVMSETGGLFMGQGQLWHTYQPLPAEFIGGVGESSKAGYFRGITNIGDTITGLKQATAGGKFVPGTESMLAEFYAGLTDPYKGLTAGNIEIAIKSGFSRSRRTSEGIKHPILSRGERTIANVHVQGFTANAPQATAAYQQQLFKIAGVQGKAGDIKAEWEKLKELERLTTLPGQSKMFFMVPSKEGQVPLEGVEQWPLEGTVTEKQALKGIAHRSRPKEIPFAQASKIAQELRSISHEGMRRPLQASPIGMTAGEFANLSVVQRAYGGAIGEIFGSKEVFTTQQVMPVLFKYDPTESGALSRELFGDPTVRLTESGKRMFSGMKRVSHTTSLSANLERLEQISKTLEADAGEAVSKDIIESLRGTGEKGVKSWEGPAISLTADTRKRLKQLRVQIPRGVDTIDYIEHSEFDQKLKFGFSSTKNPRAVEAVAGGQRAMMVAGAKTAEDVYGGLVAGVTSQSVLSQMDPEDIRFRDILELSAYSKGGSEEFISEYHKLAGENAPKLSLRYSPLGDSMQIVPEVGKDISYFYDPAIQALERGGISRDVIAGKAKARASFYGMDPKLFNENDLLLNINVLHRPRGTEDITSNAKALRLRLQYMQTLAKGHQEVFGVAPKDNPIFMRMVEHYRDQTGLDFDPQFLETGQALGSIAVNKTKSAQYTHIQGVLKQYQSKEAVEAFAKEYNVPIASEEEVLKEFITGRRGIKFDPELKGRGMPSKAFDQSSLFNQELRRPEWRRGVMMKRKRSVPIPLTNKAINGIVKESQTVVDSEYLWIPGTDPKLRGVWGTATPDEGLNIRFGAESVEHNTLAYLTHLAYPESSTESLNADKFASDLGRSYADYTRKSGKLNEVFLTAGPMEGGAQMRILPKDELRHSVSAFDELVNAKAPTEEMFTVGVTKSDINRIFGNKSKEAMKAFDKEGFIWGQVHPFPFLSTANASIVKYKLIAEREGAIVRGAETELSAQMGGFLTWKMYRDNDKDVVNALMTHDVTPEDAAKLQSIWQHQLKSSESEYETYLKEVKEARKQGVKTAEDFQSLLFSKAARRNTDDLLKHYGGYLRFGRTPTLSYAGHWTWSSIVGSLATSHSDETVAQSLNKSLPARARKIPFTSESIALLRKTMGTNPRKLAAISSLLEADVLQAFITKGGKYQESAIDLLSIANTIREGVDSNKGMTIEEAVQTSIQGSKKFFGALAGLGKEEADKLRLPGATMSMLFAEGKDKAARVALAAEIHGRAVGVGLHTYLTHVAPEDRAANTFDLLRATTKHRAGASDLSSMAAAFGIEYAHPRAGLVPTGQQSTAILNQATKTTAESIVDPGSKVADKALSWLGRNWKIAGAVIGGVAGLRMASQLLSDDELERPPLRSSQRLRFRDAPLPPEPMVTPQSPEIDVSSAVIRPRAYVQPVNGTYNKTQYNASYDTVNMDTMAFANSSFGGVEINDSRSHATNWQMQSIANSIDDSDFYHPYIPMV